MNNFTPHAIVVERDVRNEPLTRTILEKFPQAQVREVRRLRDSAREDAGSRTVCLARKRGAIIKRCPCSKGTWRCNYYLFDVGFGCTNRCTYCFLNFYANFSGMVIHTNLDEIFDKAARFFDARKHRLFRVGTSELTDPLALEPVAGYIKPFVQFFSRYDNVLFEVKTKLSAVDALCDVPVAGKGVLAAWSMNPQNIIDDEEHGSARLNARLKAARHCAEHGYALAFHLDPVIPEGDWQEAYSMMIQRMARELRSHRIAWISVGTFRFDRAKRNIVQERFPESRLMYGELFKGYDGKLRYFRPFRVEVYRFIVDEIRKVLPETFVYLCMESRAVWDEVFGADCVRAVRKKGFEQLFFEKECSYGL